MARKDHDNLKSIAKRIDAKFRSLLAETVGTTSEHALAAPRLLSESQRFDVWGHNLGVFQGGHASLDYRFRDTPRVFDFAQRLLSNLDDTLNVAGTVLHEPWVHDSSSQRQTVENKHQQPTQTTGASAEQDVPSVGDSSDDDDDAEDDDDEFLDSYRSVPVATIALDSIADILDRLYRLAFKIRHPSLRIGLSKASVYEDKDPESGIELFAASQSLDQAHVDQVLHSLRARYPKHTDGETQAKVNILQEDSGLQEQTATSQPGQPPSLATSVTKVEDSKVDLRDSQSTFSNVTYSLAKQESDREKVPIPELPGSFLEPKEFECPFCFELCPRKMGRGPDWETHVMRDLRPYVCLYEQCAAGDQLFDTFQSWRTHQLEHEPAPASSALSMPMGQDSRQCPLCLADGKTWVHIAVHLQRIATFALPTLLPDEDGDRSFADVSNQAADFDSPDGSNQAANFDDSSSGAGTQVTDPPVREQTGLVCGKCYMSRPSDELQFCAQCFDLPDAFSSYYCRNFCSSAECGHAKDCNVSGHLPCWVEHKRQTSHEPHNSGPTEEGIQTLPLTDKVHNATVMLDYLKGTAGVSTSVLPTQYSAVGESSAVGEFSAAEAAGAHDAVGYEAMLNQYHKLEQQVMMENMIMQGADLPQAFWNPLESMSKKDVTS